jgi:hypothetical protein
MVVRRSHLVRSHLVIWCEVVFCVLIVFIFTPILLHFNHYWGTYYNMNGWLVSYSTIKQLLYTVVVLPSSVNGNSYWKPANAVKQNFRHISPSWMGNNHIHSFHPHTKLSFNIFGSRIFIFYPHSTINQGYQKMLCSSGGENDPLKWLVVGNQLEKIFLVF